MTKKNHFASLVEIKGKETLLLISLNLFVIIGLILFMPWYYKIVLELKATKVYLAQLAVVQDHW
jgi:hypothetical protein